MPSHLAQKIAVHLHGIMDTKPSPKLIGQMIDQFMPDGDAFEKILMLVQHGEISRAKAMEAFEYLLAGTDPGLPEFKGILNGLLVPIERLQELEAENVKGKAAIKMMEALGFTYEGGAMFKPPIGLKAEASFKVWERDMAHRQLDELKVPVFEHEDYLSLWGRFRYYIEELKKLPKDKQVIAVWEKVVKRSGITVLDSKKYLMLDEESCMELGATMESLGWIHKEGD